MKTITALCQHGIGYASFIVDTPYGRSIAELSEWLLGLDDGTITVADVILDTCTECVADQNRETW